MRPVELVTVPPALGMIVLGAHALRTRPEARTWPTLGPGLALLTLPSLIYDFASPSLLSGLATTSLWRVVALGIVAIALVVIGAIWRLQAPLLLGSAVLIVHAAAQFWPWVSNLYTVPVVAVARDRRRAAHLHRRALRAAHAAAPRRLHGGDEPALSAAGPSSPPER